MADSNAVFAFEVWPKWKPEWATVINARTAGKAKYQVWLDLKESYQDTPITDMRSRKVGQPQTNQMFEHVAQLRGMPELRCGQRVTFAAGYGKTASGVLVDAGGGANFGVLCDKDSIWPDKTIYVHPTELITTDAPPIATQDRRNSDEQ